MHVDAPPPNSLNANIAMINGETVPYDFADNGLTRNPITTIEEGSLFLFLGTGTKVSEAGVAKVNRQVAYHFWRAIPLKTIVSLAKTRKI